MLKTIQLNKKNIQGDKLRTFVREQGLGSKLLDDETLLKSRRSLVPDNTKSDVWLFGYGSLIWNPVVEPIKKLKVKTFGYRRRYCLKTQIGRGSKKFPGLVLGLENGGSVTGQALKINNKKIYEELEKFYLSLLKSEGRHFKDYLALAETVASQQEVSDRLAVFLAIEKQLIESPDSEFRFHSGPYT